MKTFLILLTDGVMDSSLAITLDTLKTGQAFMQKNRHAEQYKVVLAGHRKKVRTGAGFIVQCDLTFREVQDLKLRPNWLVLPGSGLKTEPEITHSFQKKEVIALMLLLSRLDHPGVNVSASCASVFVLAQAGLLDGRTATTTWWLSSIFRKMYPLVTLDETKMLVRDGRLLTAGAAFSQMDVALEILTETAGASVAYLCSRYLLIEQRSSQARYMIPTQNQKLDPMVIAAETWIDANLSRAISVQELAANFAVSAKTLSRRLLVATGDSPIKFIQRRKLMRAIHLIESTELQIEVVAEHVGYQNGTMLRSLIKRELGILPSKLR
jgi:transcriptional regulator GlxA family with amidase domain